MSKKLIQKLHRRERNVLASQRKPDPDARDQREEKKQDSPRILSTLRGIKRKLAKWFGYDVLGHRPRLMADLVLTSVARFDYGAGSFGIKCTPASSNFGVRPGDYIQFKSGSFKGKELKVISVGASDFRVEDQPSFMSTGEEEVTQIECVDDVSSSLNDTYFYINSAGDATEYYVWFNVDSAGTDPAIVGKTGVEVAIAEDATKEVIAEAVKDALDAIADFDASFLAEVVEVVNVDVGDTTDASDAGATGFTISVTTAGADPAPLSESTVQGRLLLGLEKKSYK